MKHTSANISAGQLVKEIELVKKILHSAENDKTLDIAVDLSLELMKTQTTNAFSSIDVNEYVRYRFDLQEIMKRRDYEKQKGVESNIKISYEEIQEDLKKATELLKTIETAQVDES